MKRILPVLVLAIALAGCATAPTLTITAAAPPPGSPSPAASTWTPPAPPAQAAAAEPAAPEPVSVAVETATPAAEASPPPRTFTVVEALTDINFDFDKHDVDPGNALILDTDVEWLAANPNSLVLIEGHADERGTNEYNLALGERRAKSTMSYLAEHGIQAERITLVSYGKEHPLCAGRTEECWAENRRAHFLVKAGE